MIVAVMGFVHAEVRISCTIVSSSSSSSENVTPWLLPSLVTVGEEPSIPFSVRSTPLFDLPLDPDLRFGVEFPEPPEPYPPPPKPNSRSKSSSVTTPPLSLSLSLRSLWKTAILVSGSGTDGSFLLGAGFVFASFWTEMDTLSDTSGGGSFSTDSVAANSSTLWSFTLSSSREERWCSSARIRVRSEFSSTTLAPSDSTPSRCTLWRGTVSSLPSQKSSISLSLFQHPESQLHLKPATKA